MVKEKVIPKPMTSADLRELGVSAGIAKRTGYSIPTIEKLRSTHTARDAELLGMLARASRRGF